MTHKHAPPPATQLLHEPVVLRHARTVTGAGLGKTIGVPTINIHLADVPRLLRHGIYACSVQIGDRTFMGALHYGPRPAVNAGVAMEVHLIDATLSTLPAAMSITIVGRIRDVRDFPSLEAMRRQIGNDVETARGMLRA